MSPTQEKNPIGELDSGLAQPEAERADHQKQRQPGAEAEEEHAQRLRLGVDAKAREPPGRHFAAPPPRISPGPESQIHSPGARSAGRSMAPTRMRLSASTRLPQAATMRLT